MLSVHSLVCLLGSGFTSHQTVARTAGNVLLRLSDSLLLPFNLTDYAESLEQYLNTALKNFGSTLAQKKISVGKPGFIVM